jgi:SAM-dependent methyltransferase
MPEDVLNCPLCQSAHSNLFDQREFRGRKVKNHLCPLCGLVYQSPRMTAEESSAFYAGEYRLLYEGEADPTSRNMKDQRGRADSLFSFIRPSVPSITNYLDIGCSYGLLLKRFQEGYHCQATGIEPGETHRTRAGREGLSVYATLDEMAAGATTRFDLISMVHVLEHLPDPVGYLSRLRESFLSQAGWLLLEVPNLYTHDSFEIAHLVSFCAHTLEQVLAKAGYRAEKIRLHGQPRSRLLPLYVTILARPLPNPLPSWQLQPERSVVFKRQSGMILRLLLERLFPHQAWIS